MFIAKNQLDSIHFMVLCTYTFKDKSKLKRFFFFENASKIHILGWNDTPHHPSDIQRDREAEGPGVGLHPAGILPRDLQRGDQGPAGYGEELEV